MENNFLRTVKERKPAKASSQNYYISNIGNHSYVYTNEDTINAANQFATKSTENVEYILSYADTSTNSNLSGGQYIVSGEDIIEVID